MSEGTALNGNVRLRLGNASTPHTPLPLAARTGAIGLATFEALSRRGRTVRLVNRSGRPAVPEGVEVVTGDAADPVFAARAARGAAVVHQTLNPP